MARLIARRRAARIVHVASSARVLLALLLAVVARPSAGQGMPDLVLDDALL